MSLTRIDKNNADLPAEQPLGPAIPPSMVGALRQAGVDLEAITVPHVTHYAKVSWENLCALNTRDPRTKVSPTLVITEIDWQPDAPKQFADYAGVVLVKFIDEYGAEQYVSHAMTYSDSGEYLPLAAWLLSVKAPCMARFGRIETSKREQFIIRPMPVQMDTE